MTSTSDLPSHAAAWSAHDGLPLLRTLATALIGLDAITGLDGFSLPYPDEAQRALNRTVLTCVLQGAEPPASLPELLQWCRYRPVSDWPLDLPSDAIGDTDHLLDPDSGRPTELCHEWAERAADSAVHQRDREIIRTALRLCRECGEEDAYTEFRRLLVNRPVLTSVEFFEVSNDHVLDPVRELIRRIYLPVPASHLRAGAYTTCERCLTLLIPVQDGSWWCERDQCRRQGPAPVGNLWPADEVGELFQLERPLRQFVTGPGRSEVALEQALTELGLRVRMWPGFDAYDLHVTFPNGRVWAVDVKDWAHPAFLGRAARPLAPEPPYDEAFWVVPQYRVDDRPGYQDVYRRHRPASALGLPLFTDTELISHAATRLRNAPDGGSRA